MKYTANKIYLYAVIMLVIISQVSCKKETFTTANNNPNSPGVVIPGNILPGIETSLAYSQGGDFARYTSMLTQQDVGFSRQAAAYYSYIFTSVDFDTPWGNMFTSVLGNDKDLLNKADAAGYNVYSGIGRIILAYSLQLLVDSWGNIPYTEALQGDAQHHPAYDNDKILYDTISNLIDVAITQLNSSDPGGQTPSTDDLIYGGDPSLWIKFGHAIKARIYIHQSKGDATMAAKALDEANMAFEDESESAQFVFGTTETFSNPIYQFNEQRSDIDYGSGYLANLLTSLNDPRLGLTADPSYSDDFQDGVGRYYGAINGHVEFIMYDEIEFLKAEAILRSTGDYATAQTHYQNGIRADMQKLGISDTDIDTYIVAHGTLPATSVDAAIAAVATQEYIALYQNPEAWTLWRRTGSPNLTATAGTNGIPRRFLYPQSEISLNGENTPDATLFSPKIFWDK
jgi:hypothetical protein